MRRRFFVLPGVFLAGFCLFFYVVLPRVIHKKLNQAIQRIPEHEGAVESVSLHLLPPAIVLHRVRLAKRQDVAPAAFVTIEEVRLDLSWLDLARFRLAGSLLLRKPEARFLLRQRRVGQKLRAGVWQEPLQRLPPFRLDRLAVQEGILHFQNDDAIPPVDFRVTDLNATASPVANDARLLEGTTCQVQATGKIQGHAPATVTMRVHPFSEPLTFDVQGRLQGFEMTSLNPTLRHYTGIEIQRGSLEMNADLRVREGAFQGTVHRSIQDLTLKKNYKGVMKDLKSGIAQWWLDFHEDDKTEGNKKDFQFSGPIGFYEKDVVLAGVWVLKGAFLQSIKPKLDDSVRLASPDEMITAWAEFQAKQRQKAGRTD